MGTDWRGQGNNEPNNSTESRGWTAHKSLIFVSKASSYNLEHPGKKTFPLKKNPFLLIPDGENYRISLFWLSGNRANGMLLVSYRQQRSSRLTRRTGTKQRLCSTAALDVPRHAFFPNRLTSGKHLNGKSTSSYKFAEMLISSSFFFFFFPGIGNKITSSLLPSLICSPEANDSISEK